MVNTITIRAGLLASVALTAMTLVAPAAAGGFAVREQSAEQQGMSFAGAAASGSIGSMFWNSAAVTSQDGTNSISNLSIIIPVGDLTAQPGSTYYNVPGVPQSTDIGRTAYVPASYINYQFKNYDPNLYIGLGVNAPFGLSTEPDKRNWAGAEVGRTSKLFTINFNPVIGYRLSSQLAIGIGAQFEQAEAGFKFATGLPSGTSSYYDGNSFAAGATAGLLFTPTAGTSIGLGWRSELTHKLHGTFATNPGFPVATGVPGVPATVDLKLPDIVTLSLKQAVTSGFRVYGTVEWTNWSKFKELRIISENNAVTVLGFRTAGSTIGLIDAQWKDGWFFSAGADYDYSNQLTLRAGGAYEIAPTPDAQHRILGIPDADRIWASVGATYKLSQTLAVDIGYSHVFVNDAQIDRRNVSGTTRIVADLDAHADIIAVGLKVKLGGGDEPLK